MKERYMTLAKSLSTASLKIVGISAASFFLGLLLNSVLLLFLIPELKAMADMQGARAGSIGDIIVLGMRLIKMWPLILTVMGFGLLFPVGYFLCAKSYAVSRELKHLTLTHKDWVIGLLYDAVKKALEAASNETGKSGMKLKMATQIKNIPSLLEGHSDWPRPVRALAGIVLKKAGLAEIVSQVGGKFGKESSDAPGERDAAIKSEISAFIEKKISPPSLKAFYVLMAVNFAVFTALKFYA